MKKLLLISAILIFSCSSDSEGNDCVYEPTLSTEAVTDITETSATLNGVISIISQNCDVPNNTEQGFVYSTEIQPTIDDTQVNVNGTSISTTIEGLVPNTTYYVRSFLTNNLGEFYGNEVSFITVAGQIVLNTLDVTDITENSAIAGGEILSNGNTLITSLGVCWSVNTNPTIEDNFISNDIVTTSFQCFVEELTPNTQYYVRAFASNEFSTYYGNEVVFSSLSDCEVVYLDDNGVTIRAFDCANIGDTGMVNGIEYTVVDEAMLEQMVENEADITVVCTTRVSNMLNMFAGNNSFNQDIGNWDVSNVTNMGGLFSAAESFNQPIGNWDVSNVISMRKMFGGDSAGLTVFNQDISSWDVSNVTNMQDMFLNNLVFNQDIGSWDVSNVTNMQTMFNVAKSFNQDISSWDVSNVTNMARIFSGTTSNPTIFNQPIGSWDVSNVIDMTGMFWHNIFFNQPIGNWDVGNVTDMGVMFGGSLAENSIVPNIFNQPIGSWNVSNVTNMFKMFGGNNSFNQDISSWDVSNVTFMQDMFNCNTVFNQYIGNWDVSNVTNMRGMFGGWSAYQGTFNQDISSWDVSNVTNMGGMFRSNTAFNQPIGSWDVSNVTNMGGLFSAAESFNQPIGSWDVSNVTSMGAMFYSGAAFNQPIGSWDVSNVIDMTGMFWYNIFFNQPIGNWDTTSVTNMTFMFSENSAFNQDIGNWSVDNVTECYNFSINTPQWILPQPNFTNCNPN
tara:strand:+ start:1389 stop:3575 length:2187 start_codon:yes stop_codon:yes gene_type:complete